MTKWSGNSSGSAFDVRDGTRTLDYTRLLLPRRTRRSLYRLAVYVCVFGAFVAASVSDCQAHAQAEPITECAPEHVGVRRATIRHEEQLGVWFALPVARCVLEVLATVESTSSRLHLLERRLELRDGQVETLRRALDLSVQAEDAAVGALEAAEAGRRRAEERTGAWWRSPYLWTGVGLVVGVGAVVLSVQVLEAT